ncbi:MAG: hypothetical protein JXA57_10545 [Armatimonadetes bacterium]|nr:hypothetical protein [Armatimonadota bacterium]
MGRSLAQTIMFVTAGVFFVVILIHRYRHESKPALRRLAASLDQLAPGERIPAVRAWARAAANFQSLLIASMLAVVCLTAVLTEGESALKLAPFAVVFLPLLILGGNAGGRFFYMKVGSRVLDGAEAKELLQEWE